MTETFEEELMEDLGYEEAEGAADMLEEAEEFEEYDEAEDEFEAEEEFEEAEEDMFEEEFEEDEAEEFEEDEAEEFEDYGEEDTFEEAMVYALGAEDTEEFWKRLKRAFRKVKKVVGKVARVAAPVAKLIPHPYAQIAAKGLRLIGKLRAEGASEEEAIEAFAELAVYDEAAVPIVAGLAARSIIKRKGARMPKAARRRIVKNMTKAAKTLTYKRGPKAIRALPPIVKSVKRTAKIRRTPARVVPKIVYRTAKNVSRSANMTKKLSRPKLVVLRRVRPIVRPIITGRFLPSRSFTLRGPVRISITSAM
jgi:hypothetical protein